MTIDEEVRSNRHDFIKEYYKMATADLDRHMKAGWQTIAVLAGGAAILTAGHEGKIGLPIATSIALVSAIWGALFVVDANYWSLRAIGFLANVEAVYFSDQDRANFNPYVGRHPPYKLLDSLRYMYWLCVIFGVAALATLLWEITRSYPTLSSIAEKSWRLDALRFCLWISPWILTWGGTAWVFRVWLARTLDYKHFTEKSPGPGISKDTANLRPVTLNSTASGAILSNLQDDLLTKLNASIGRLKRLRPYFYAGCLTAALLPVLLYIAHS